MAMPTTYSFKHPVLGLLTGVVSPETPEVVTFRAIPYATLPGRFQHSVLRENLNGVSHDFTKVGYACPHSFSLDDVYSGGIHPNQEPIECSEFESLILELNVPKAHLEDVKLQETKDTKYLPVMTYIHGGAFVLGKIDAQHNTAFMVQHSVTEKQPVIIAAIQYRLGALGFLATPDGGKNFALYDQRNALLWIQRFIEGFRGDKSQHTVFGESAGGFSICYHMLSHVPSSGPLFSRGIIMSGIVGPMTTPCSQGDADAVFESLCLKLEVKEKGSAALDKLRSLDVQKLVDASEAWDNEGNSWLPVDDPSFFREKVTWERIPELLGSCEWVNDIVVGNTGFEGQVYSSVAKSMTPQTFQDHLSKSLSNAATAKVMKAYDVSLNMDQNLFLTSAMRWCGDVIFDGRPNILFHILKLFSPSSYSTNSRVLAISNKQRRQAPLPLHLRRSKSLSQRTSLSTSSPLGRCILFISRHAVPIPQPVSQRPVRRACKTLVLVCPWIDANARILPGRTGKYDYGC